jgi:hypothetical protein
LCFAANVFSIDVIVTHSSRLSRETLWAGR